MYVVTDAYITAMKQPVQFSRMTGTIDDTIKFDDSNIIKDSFSMTNQCSDGDYVQIGTVYVGELTCTFIGIDDIDRNDWAGRVIKPVYQQRLGDGTYFDIKLGVFTVASAEWSENGITITAYDNMQKFDIEYPINNSTGGRATNTPWWWLNGLCYACEMELANTWEEIVAFQNGEEQLTLYTTDNVYTYRDLLHWLTQAMGCFATIDRDGKLILKTYGDEPIDTIDRAHRFKGGEFADFNTRYETVELFDLIKGDWQVFKSEYWGNGLTYSLYDNPFLQTEDDTTRNHWLSNIYNVLFN